MKKPIIIADSSELILKGLKSILKSKFDNDISLVDNFDSLHSALSIDDNVFLIIDYTSKGFSLDQVIDIKNSFNNVIIIAITPYINAQTIVKAIQAGVQSHIKKECSVKEINEAFEATNKGDKFFCADIVKQMRDENVNIKKISFNTLKSGPVQLSNRELQIIQFIAEGYTNSQIAAIVYLSNHTINTHRKNIMKKLGVNNTAGIVMYAVKNEMVSPGQFSFRKTS